MFKNIKYDIRAIKKYGLLTHVKYLWDYKKVIICLHYDNKRKIAVNLPRDYSIKSVDFYDKKILDEWSDIVNDAFNRQIPYNIETALEYLINHAYKEITTLLFLYHKNIPIGTIFAGKCTGESNYGTLGRLAIIKEYQGQRLSKFLYKALFNELNDQGIHKIEGIYVYDKMFSVYIGLKSGGVPIFSNKKMAFKNRSKKLLVRLWVYMKVYKLYRKLKRSDKNETQQQ